MELTLRDSPRELEKQEGTFTGMELTLRDSLRELEKQEGTFTGIELILWDSHCFSKLNLRFSE